LGGIEFDFQTTAKRPSSDVIRSGRKTPTFERMINLDDSPNRPFCSDDILMERRRLMSGLGLAGLGWLVSSTSAGAYTPCVAPHVTVRRPAEVTASVPLDVASLPPDWVRHQGSLLREYTGYLGKLKLKAISPSQVIEAHAKSKGAVWNCLPPKAWWTRMGYTLRVADRIAAEMNVHQVEVVSAYRCPAYNAHCEGAKVGSWHQANVAVDVKFPVRASQVTATARNLRDRGLFKGGIGGYWNFTHIDTRGENMNW
jgi:Peptidase M15